jgi:hypothetical protein
MKPIRNLFATSFLSSIVWAGLPCGQSQPVVAAIALAALALFAAARPAHAQMTPVTDVRQVSADVSYHGMTDHQAQLSPGSFIDWEATATADVQDPDAGSCSSVAYQITQFHPAGLYYAGSAGGGWALPAGTYGATSLLDWTVQTSTCLSYTLHAEAVPSDPSGTCYVRMSSGGITYASLTDGVVDRTGQMPAGQYRFEGRSSFNTSVESFSGGTYSLVLFCSACSGGSIIVGQPRDTTLQCDKTATFCITPAAAGGPFTYQWYNKDGALTDNGHFTGVQTPCLSIQHACYADAGAYAVVVTATGSRTAETSQVAHLAISGIAVGVGPGAGVVALELGPAMPNPFTASTVVRYQAPAPFFAHVAVFDAAGRVVRRLADRVLDASGTLTWDGRTTSGAPAVPGIYFVRVEGNGRAETRRLALVR